MTTTTEFPFIAELQSGQRITGFYAVAQAALEPFKNKPGHYLSLTLADKTGRISAKVWEVGALTDDYIAGMVVKVAADVSEYNGALQLTLTKIRAAQADEYDLARLLPTTARNTSEMYALVQNVVSNLGHPHLAALAAHFFSDPIFIEQFNLAPVSRVHHAYLGGLLEQTYCALRLADNLPAVYPMLNADLLYTAILLAQVGKVREFTIGVSIDPTDDGELIGDIALTLELVNVAIATLPDFPGELARQLKHILLAQNGRYEWGSPRRPATLEAYAVHYLLDMTAHLGHAAQRLAERQPGEMWAARDRLAGKLYGGSVQLDYVPAEVEAGGADRE